jgi:TPR repeat protein
MANPITWAQGIGTSVAEGRRSVGRSQQYLGLFPGAEAGITDPFLREYLAAGKALERDRVQGLAEITLLADRGSVLSMLFLADSLRNGDDGKADLNKSEGWYSRAASLGSGRALYGLGLIQLRRGEIAKAVQAFEAAGEQRCGAALWALGLIYKQGDESVAPDIEQARAHFERGASLGHVWSSRSLSVLLMSGHWGFLAHLRGVATYLTGFVAAAVAILSNRHDRVMR